MPSIGTVSRDTAGHDGGIKSTNSFENQCAGRMGLRVILPTTRIKYSIDEGVEHWTMPWSKDGLDAQT